MKFFKEVLEIKSRKGDLHFKRFAIFESRYVSLYIHRIYLGEKDTYCHSHPWNFISVILKGTYIEGTPNGERHVKSPLTATYSNRNRFHKIEEVVSGPVVSLFLAFGKRKTWYYNVNGEQMEHTRFREIKHLPQYQYLFK